jgi:mono/diheme cytochrome c family protein
MFTGLLHTHMALVLLFLIHYVIKLLLLQLGKTEQLAKYTKVTRVPEMIVSFGFLVTGIWMLAKGSMLTTLLIVKILCVLAAIPLAIIGFKKSNKMLATLSVVLIIAAYGLAEVNKARKTGGKIEVSTSDNADPLVMGKAVYEHSCVSCHGADGKLGLAGAKDLSASQLSDADKKQIIRNGKNSMPPYSTDVLTDAQLDAVVGYISTLKQ